MSCAAPASGSAAVTWFCFPGPHSSLPSRAELFSGTSHLQALALGSGALLGLFTQLQQTPKMKVRPRSVLLRKSPSLFLRKRKTNIFLSLGRRGGVWAWILLGAPPAANPALLPQLSLHTRQLPIIFPSLDLSWPRWRRVYVASFPCCPCLPGLHLSVPKGRPSGTSFCQIPALGSRTGAREVKPTQTRSPDCLERLSAALSHGWSSG